MISNHVPARTPQTDVSLTQTKLMSSSASRCRGGQCQPLYRWSVSAAVQVVSASRCTGGQCQPLYRWSVPGPAAVQVYRWSVSAAVQVVSVSRCTGGQCQPLHRWSVPAAVQVVSVSRCTGGQCQPLYRWSVPAAVQVVSASRCTGGQCQGQPLYRWSVPAAVQVVSASRCTGGQCQCQPLYRWSVSVPAAVQVVSASRCRGGQSEVCFLAGCLTFQQYVSVSQGRICTVLLSLRASRCSGGQCQGQPRLWSLPHSLGSLLTAISSGSRLTRGPDQLENTGNERISLLLNCLQSLETLKFARVPFSAACVYKTSPPN